MKLELSVGKLLDNKLVNPLKTWIAKKWFGGDERLMMGFFGTLAILLAIGFLYFMTCPSDALINFVQSIFETMGWW